MQWLLWLIPVAVALSLYAAVVLSIVGVAGWHQAHAFWPAPPGMTGRRCGFARLHLVRLNFLLRVGVHPEGLFLGMPAAFRFGSGDILVPWTKVTLVESEPGVFAQLTRVDILGWGTMHAPKWLLTEWEAAGRPMRPADLPIPPEAPAPETQRTKRRSKRDKKRGKK